MSSKPNNIKSGKGSGKGGVKGGLNKNINGGKSRMSRLTTLTGPQKGPKGPKNQKGATGGSQAGRVGFVGGISKLREKQNERPISDPKYKPQPKITRAVLHHRRTTKMEQKVLFPEELPDESMSEESSELETVDSEHEDMERFCKRMCQKSLKLIENEKELKQEELDKDFKKKQRKFLKSKLDNFRIRVKENMSKGKFDLFVYKKDDQFEGYTINRILTYPPEESGLKKMTDYVHPFKLFHYASTVRDDYFVVEITWAAPSIRNLKAKPNKLPDKTVRRVPHVHGAVMWKSPQKKPKPINPTTDVVYDE